VTVQRAVLVCCLATVLALSGCGQSSGRGTDAPSSAAPPPDPFQAFRLDCDGGDSTVWSTDPSAPALGVTIEDALSRYPDAALAEQNNDRAVATVKRSGRVVQALVLSRWTNGSWLVESGSACSTHP
jgi:hypothetical protein